MRRWILNYTASANIIFISFQMTALPSKKNVHEWIEKQTDVNNPQGPDYIWLAGTCTPKLSICPNNPFRGLHQQSVGSPTCETNNPLLPWAYTKWVCMAVWPTPCNLMPISWLVPCYAEPRSAWACIDAAHWSLPIIASLIRYRLFSITNRNCTSNFKLVIEVAETATSKFSVSNYFALKTCLPWTKNWKLKIEVAESVISKLIS